MIGTISLPCYICFLNPPPANAHSPHLFLILVRAQEGEGGVKRGRNSSNVMLKSLWSVALALASGDVFDRPNNPIGRLHSSSFHTLLYYSHEQLQLAVVVGYCRLLLRAPVFLTRAALD